MLLFYVQEFPIGVLNQDSRLPPSVESNRERLSSRTRAGKESKHGILCALFRIKDDEAFYITFSLSFCYLFPFYQMLDTKGKNKYRIKEVED